MSITNWIQNRFTIIENDNKIEVKNSEGETNTNTSIPGLKGNYKIKPSSEINEASIKYILSNNYTLEQHIDKIANEKVSKYLNTNEKDFNDFVSFKRFGLEAYIYKNIYKDIFNKKNKKSEDSELNALEYTPLNKDNLMEDLFKIFYLSRNNKSLERKAYIDNINELLMSKKDDYKKYEEILNHTIVIKLLEIINLNNEETNNINITDIKGKTFDIIYYLLTNLYVLDEKILSNSNKKENILKNIEDLLMDEESKAVKDETVKKDSVIPKSKFKKNKFNKNKRIKSSLEEKEK